MNPPKNMWGLRVTPPAGPGSFLGKAWRALVTDTINCLWNQRFFAKILAPDGTQTQLVEAKFEMGPMGSVGTLDLTSIVSGSSTPSNVPFSGAGAPSSSTLSSSYSYVAGANPSLYVDTTNRVLYFCTTAGTNATSAWQQITSPLEIIKLKFVSDGGDNLNCVDFTTPTPVVYYVAKNPKLRTSLSGETIRGVTYTYTYTPTYISGTSGPVKYYTRNVSGSDGSSETDLAIPDLLVDDIIFAIPCADTGTGASYIEVASARAWCQQ